MEDKRLGSWEVAHSEQRGFRARLGICRGIEEGNQVYGEDEADFCNKVS